MSTVTSRTQPCHEAAPTSLVRSGWKSFILCASDHSIREENKSDSSSDANDDVHYSLASVRICRGRLLKWLFDIDIEHCLSCGGNMRTIAAILEASAIIKILDHLGIPIQTLLRSLENFFELFESI